MCGNGGGGGSEGGEESMWKECVGCYTLGGHLLSGLIAWLSDSSMLLPHNTSKSVFVVHLGVISSP